MRIEVLLLKDGAWMLAAAFGGSDVVKIQPFDAIQLDLARLWSDAAASPPPSEVG